MLALSLVLKSSLGVSPFPEVWWEEPDREDPEPCQGLLCLPLLPGASCSPRCPSSGAQKGPIQCASWAGVLGKLALGQGTPQPTCTAGGLRTQSPP